MFDNLYGTLRRLLFPLWSRRHEGIVVGAIQAEASGMSVKDAYTEGYRTAYFDAVSDLVDEGLLRTSPPAMARAMQVIEVSDEVH